MRRTFCCWSDCDSKPKCNSSMKLWNTEKQDDFAPVGREPKPIANRKHQTANENTISKMNDAGKRKIRHNDDDFCILRYERFRSAFRRSLRERAHIRWQSMEWANGRGREISKSKSYFNIYLENDVIHVPFSDQCVLVFSFFIYLFVVCLFVRCRATGRRVALWVVRMNAAGCLWWIVVLARKLFSFGKQSTRAGSGEARKSTLR